MASIFALSADAQEQPPANVWIDELPDSVRASVLWHADHEEGSLADWTDRSSKENAGGGIFNTGKPHEAISKVTRNRAFQGDFSAQATIANALNSQYGKKAVRLMRWTDKPWDQDGRFFPAEAYYGVWIYLDRNYSPKKGDSSGWWNVFQFKSNDAAGKSQPVWALNVGNDSPTGGMQFYLYSKENRPAAYAQRQPISIPTGRWFHVEAFYKQSNKRKRDGAISIWQDGKLILQATNVVTMLDGNSVWGIGNYTDHITGGPKPGSATIWFDDATVSTLPTHASVPDFLENHP